MAQESKKLALLRIFHILQKHSDENHPLTQEDIVSLLVKNYGIEVDRKLEGRQLSLLREAYDEPNSAYTIITERKKGTYIQEREFNDSELRLLIDGVLSSGYITAKHSRDLIEKLCAQSNEYFRPRVKNIYSVNDWNKTDNVSVFYTIEIVDEAIEKGKQVRFEYNKYGADKKLHRTSRQTLSPYQMILHNQRYYLMGRNEKWQEMRYYRMDRITNIELVNEPSTPLRSIKGFESGIDYKRFSQGMPYMFADEPQMIEFIADGWAIDQIVDWFGKDIFMEERQDGRFLVRVNVSINAMEYWAMQYMNAVEVLSPKELRERIKKNVQVAHEKYKE